MKPFGSFRHGLCAAMMIMMACSLLMNFTLQAQCVISGTVSDKKAGTPLSGANLFAGPGSLATITDASGRFSIKVNKCGKVTLKASFMGYTTFQDAMVLRHDTIINIRMEGGTLLGDEVNITSTRAHEKYPMAFSSISKKELGTENMGKDIPTLLQGNTSTVTTSDAGNGVGYSTFSIRGTDLTRINVTVNSIPLNDAESQGVWFVDLPDMASSAENIQIQRGVGTSTNGAGAFGASVNFMTSDLKQDPYGELDLSGGSFNTFKTTLRFGTGLMSSKFSIDGRVSYIHSDGYIDRAFSNLKSYYIAGGYYGKNTTIRLITFSGFERTYQAWEGVPKDSLKTNRTYNPAGQYIAPDGSIAYYKDQTDNYQQDHYQLLFSQLVKKNWNINAAIHYTRGNGYYENYKQGDDFSGYGLQDVILGNDTISSTDLVNRKMMSNDFYGITFSSNYTIPDKMKMTLGGAWNQYDGHHYGKVTWARYASNGDNDRNWYYNTGLKSDFNIYGKFGYQISSRLSLLADMQYRHVSYVMKGTLDDLRNVDQDHTFNFFNPKGGLFFELNEHHSFYCSAGVANREPSRNNYKDADPGKEPTNETLYDYELGYTLKTQGFTLGANAYYMVYRNQLVLTGEINNVGEAVMVNVPHSYREGIELSAAVEFFRKKLTWNVNATLSNNKIVDFVQYIDLYDADSNYLGQHRSVLGKTDLSFSPGFIAGSVITWKPVSQVSLSLVSKYVGKQFIDNTSSDERSLPGYLINGIRAGYTIRTGLPGEIRFNLSVNNLFNLRYESNAWVYPYYLGGSYNEYNGYFPQALINFLVGVSVKI